AKTGTLGMLIRNYRASREFAALMPRSKDDYNKVLDFLSRLDAMPIVAVTQPFVVELRDSVSKRRKRRFANYVLSVLSVVFGHACERGDAKINPVKGVKKVRPRADEPRRNRLWSSMESDAVISRAPDQLKLPIAIGRWTGLREGDVLRLT